MSRELQVGGRAVPLAIRRTAAARQITLRADPVRRELRLTLPVRASERAALRWLDGQRAWAAAEVARWPAPRPFGNGAVVDVAGVPRRIVLDPGGPVRARLEADAIRAGGDALTLPGRVTRLLRREALAVLTAETQALAATLGRGVTVGIGDPATRWGSCASGGRIRYSWRLILMPPWVRASIVAHEVAHLAHPNHSPAFWRHAEALLGASHLPARAWLKQHGPSLHAAGRV